MFRNQFRGAGRENLPSQNPYLFGDANLDGTVDGLDFIVWNENRFTDFGVWCGGDFNADATVDGQDFIIWNENRFQSSLIQPNFQESDRSLVDDSRFLLDDFGRTDIERSELDLPTWNHDDLSQRRRPRQPENQGHSAIARIEQLTHNFASRRP